jgi:hypothetical protein
MAYKAPGVYVTDTYVEPTTQTQGARFTPAVVGIPRKIYENYNTGQTVQGSSITATETNISIVLDKMLNDFDSITEVKAFLVPKGTLSQMYLNTFTKTTAAVDSNKFESYKPEGVLELKSSAIVVSGTTVTLKLSTSNLVDSSKLASDKEYYIFLEFKANVNAEAAKSTTTTNYVFDSNAGLLTITLNEPNLKLPSANDKITVSVKLKNPVSTVNIDITDPSKVIDRTKGTIVAQSSGLQGKSTSDIDTVTVSYKIVNPIFQGMKLCSTNDEIESIAGPIHPLNTFAYTASLALATAQDTGVALVAVPSSDATAISTALSYIDIDDSIYAVAFALNAKTGLWLEQVNQWLDQYEKSMSVSVPRIAFVGFEDLADYGNTISPAEAAANMTSFAFKYEQKRLRILANTVYITDYAPRDLSGLIPGVTFPIKVPGYTWGGVYVGTVCYYMNNDRPDYSFTLKPAANVSKLYFPNGLEQWFTQDQLNQLSASGLWVLSRRPGTQTVVTRHAVTTAETKSSTFDDSIVRIVDYIMLDLRSVLDNMIGNIRLDDHSIRLNIVPAISERMKKYQSAGLISADSKLNFAQVDPTNKNVLNLSITLKVAGSADVIQVAFVVM